MTVLVGADPEFFLKKGNQYVSAHNVVPGSKLYPYDLLQGAVQADGTAVEFNIAPAISSDQFVSHIDRTLAQIRAIVPRELEFDFQPSVLYPQEYFDSLPQNSKDLGCDPDYDAYTGRPNPRPVNPAFPTLRTGAGHIHIGWTKDADPLSKSHMWDCCQLVKLFDGYFPLAAKVWDKDNLRKSLYGRSGAFRPKPYGLEYRVLSNAWVKYPKLWPWIFDSAQYLFKFCQNGRHAEYVLGYNNMADILKHKYPKSPPFPLDAVG